MATNFWIVKKCRYLFPLKLEDFWLENSRKWCQKYRDGGDSKKVFWVALMQKKFPKRDERFVQI